MKTASSPKREAESACCLIARVPARQHDPDQPDRGEVRWDQEHRDEDCRHGFRLRGYAQSFQRRRCHHPPCGYSESRGKRRLRGELGTSHAKLRETGWRKRCDCWFFVVANGTVQFSNAPQVHNNNVNSAFIALRAAGELGIKRFCLASSVNAIGLAYANQPLNFDYFP